MEAIRTATETLDQIIFAEYTHEPAEQLARGLIRIAPPGLTHVFYSDSGSTSVEVALKMALGFFHNAGAPRSERVPVLDPDDVAVPDRVGQCASVPASVWRRQNSFRRGGTRYAGCIRAVLPRGQVAALLIEPLVLGAAAWMYPPHLQLKRITETHGCLLMPMRS
jgi:adenosylmethionine-8-amino-7-oxononanoate aminotransferase